MLNRFILFILSLFIFSGCLKDPESVTIADLSDVFSLDLSQTLGLEHQFQLDISMQDLQSCEEVVINSELLTLSDDLILQINSIEKPEDCKGKLSKIYKRHDLNQAQGIYNFNLSLADVSLDNGFIQISNDEVRIDFGDLKGINIVNNHIRKIPDQTVWGYFKSESNTISASNIEEILFDSNNNINLSSIPPGNYGYFYLDEASKVNISDWTAPEGHIPFVGNYSAADWLDMKTNVENWYNDFPDVRFVIFNEKGEEIRSK